VSDPVKPAARRICSALFVPAHQRRFRETAIECGADAVILDLEDSVPPTERPTARAEIGEWLAAAGPSPTPAVCVRINGPSEGCLDDDLAAAVRPGLEAVMVSKVSDANEVRHVADLLGPLEEQAGMPVGSVRVWPTLETAQAVRNAYELACASERVAYMGAAAAPNGDIARALGFGWTDTFLETLFLRSKVLLDVRAAGVPNPMTGVVTALRGLSELEAFAHQSRSIGYEGMMVIHPSHVAMVNAIFGPSEEELAAARRLLAATEHAATAGAGAIEHEGRMVDAAMVRVAQDLIARYAHPAPTPGHAHSAPTERAPAAGVSPAAASEAMGSAASEAETR
jgi:citrate lyase subunit beta / citryl-CoA lyase